MTTSDLITLLKENELGGATGKPREVNLKIPGYGFITDLDFSVNSTDDGLYTAICFDVAPGTIYPEEKETLGFVLTENARKVGEVECMIQR